MSELKEKAKKQGLWNLFLSKAHYPKFGVPLSNVEVCSQCIVTSVDLFNPQYGVIAEILAHAGHIGSEVMNCSAPDTGNMGAHDHIFAGISILK